MYCLPLLPKRGQSKPKKRFLQRAFISSGGLLAVLEHRVPWGSSPGVPACPLGASTPAQTQSSGCFLSGTAVLALTGSIPWQAQGCIPCPQRCPRSSGHPGREPCASPGHSCHGDLPGSGTGSLGFVLDEKEHFRSGSVSPVLLVRSCQPWKGCALGPGRWAAFGRVLCLLG